MSSPYIGQIVIFAGNYAPAGWALCAGQLLPIQQNQALFSILGVTYGGNGQSNFALPDLRGRIPVQQGQGPGLSNYTLGEFAGAETVTLNSSQMPVHTHPLNATAATGTLPSPVGAFTATGADSQGGTSTDFAPASPVPTLAPMAAASIGVAGGSQPVSVVQPYLALNFIIALVGIFPSRN
jgi:microcystin-dependent protein